MINLQNQNQKKYKFKIITDDANWSFKEDAKFIRSIFKKLLSISQFEKIINTKSINYYVDRYKFFASLNFNLKSSITCLDYFHGEPKDDSSYSEFFKKLKKYSKNISLIRVPNQKLFNAMYDHQLNHNNNISLMPIPIDTDIFFERNKNQKVEIRKKLGIPKSIFLIGSFQKDGVGWGNGFEPKLIKGPDIFLKILNSFVSNNKDNSKNIGVLLSGPSRGYIKNGLKKLKIKYWYKYCGNLSEVSELYSALDCYIISSRLEGGPKSFLEAASSMVPVISTPVGQVKDLYEGSNLMGKTFSPDEYAFILQELIDNYFQYSKSLKTKYQKLSEFYSFKTQSIIWENKFKEILLH